MLDSTLMNGGALDLRGREPLLQMVPTLLDLARQLLAASGAEADADVRALRRQIEESVVDAHRLILRRQVDADRPAR